MKKIPSAMILALSLFASLSWATTLSVSFAGNWKLDKTLSRDMPRQYQTTVSHELEVNQDAKAVAVKVDIETGRADMPRMKQDFNYLLDGSEGRSESIVRTPAGQQSVPTTTRTRVLDAGRLEINISRELKMMTPDGPSGDTRKVTMLEVWSLSEDRNKLTVHRIDEMPDGKKLEFDMVFTRKT